MAPLMHSMLDILCWRQQGTNVTTLSSASGVGGGPAARCRAASSTSAALGYQLGRPMGCHKNTGSESGELLRGKQVRGGQRAAVCAMKPKLSPDGS